MNEIFRPYLRLAELFDQLSIGSIVITNDRKILSINETARMISGLSEEPVEGKYCHKVLSKYFCGPDCLFDKALEGGLHTAMADLEITDAYEEKHSLTKIVSPVTDRNHKVWGCLEVIQDHSAFKELMERIRYEGHRMKMILDNLDLGVLTVDRNGYITLYPQVTKQYIEFGKPVSIEEKFLKLKVFYKKILPYKGWNHYTRVNIEFQDQIVCE